METKHNLEHVNAQDRLRQLFAGMSQGVVFQDADGRVLQCNPAAERILGATFEQMQAHSSADPLWWCMREDGSEWLPDDQPSMVALRTGKPTRGIMGIVHPETDACTWVSVSAVPEFRAHEPEPYQVFATFEDITELRRTKEDLRESEQEYRLLFESAPIGMFSTTSEGQVLKANPAMARMLGFDSVADAIDHYESLADGLYVDPGRRTEFLRLLSERGTVDDFEYEARTVDDRIVWLSMTARIAERFEDDSFIIEGFTHEITDRKQAEQLFYSFMESPALIAFIKDADDRYVWSNATAERISAGALAGRVTGFGMTDEAEALIAALREQDRRVLEDGVPVHASGMRFPLVTGEMFQDVFKFPIAGLNGERFVGGICLDVTERERQRRRIAHLEDQFLQSQKLETVGRLAGGVAHDFNNLLSVIISYAGFVAQELHPEDPMRADTDEIVRAAERAAALTRQLLAFSRRQVLEPKILDLNEVITNVQKMLVRLIGEDIRCEVSLGDELGLVSADPGQIEQVLMNLAVNARDAMPAGGTLRIATSDVVVDEADAREHPAGAAGAYVRIAVEDTGVGMAPDVLAMVFEPFFTTKERGKGTGLGLSTVYGIVKQSEGNISVTSEQGKGTTFEIYLPRVESVKVPAVVRPAPGRMTGSETILLVEDEAPVRQIAARILLSAGYEVLTAANGGEALLHSERHGGRIALMVTDVVMPLMNGRDLANRLARSHPAVKTLYMSGYTADAISRHGVLEPGTYFISKPFDATALVRKVREVLEDRPAEPA